MGLTIKCLHSMLTVAGYASIIMCCVFMAIVPTTA